MIDSRSTVDFTFTNLKLKEDPEYTLSAGESSSLLDPRAQCQTCQNEDLTFVSDALSDLRKVASQGSSYEDQHTTNIIITGPTRQPLIRAIREYGYSCQSEHFKLADDTRKLKLNEIPAHEEVYPSLNSPKTLTSKCYSSELASNTSSKDGMRTSVPDSRCTTRHFKDQDGTTSLLSFFDMSDTANAIPRTSPHSNFFEGGIVVFDWTNEDSIHEIKKMPFFTCEFFAHFMSIFLLGTNVDLIPLETLRKRRAEIEALRLIRPFKSIDVPECRVSTEGLELAVVSICNMLIDGLKRARAKLEISQQVSADQFSESTENPSKEVVNYICESSAENMNSFRLRDSTFRNQDHLYNNQDERKCQEGEVNNALEPEEVEKQIPVFHNISRACFTPCTSDHLAHSLKGSRFSRQAEPSHKAIYLPFISNCSDFPEDEDYFRDHSILEREHRSSSPASQIPTPPPQTPIGSCFLNPKNFRKREWRTLQNKTLKIVQVPEFLNSFNSTSAAQMALGEGIARSRTTPIQSVAASQNLTPKYMSRQNSQESVVNKKFSLADLVSPFWQKITSLCLKKIRTT